MTELSQICFGVVVAGSHELSWATGAVPSTRVYQNRVAVCKNQATEPTMVVPGVYLSHAMLDGKIN